MYQLRYAFGGFFGVPCHQAGKGPFRVMVFMSSDLYKAFFYSLFASNVSAEWRLSSRS